MKIAVSGKGGVGKTTITALLAHAFTKDGLKVIVIDADPDANLASTLGFPKDTKITPLVDLKDLIRERVGAEPGKATVYFKMNPKVDDIPDKFSVKKDNIKLMAMGTIRRGGSGCACPENVMVKQLLSHLLIQRDEVVILDMEAGIEHLGRGTSKFVDQLLVVLEPTNSSIQTFNRIKKLAADLGVKRIIPVANKIKDTNDIERIMSGIGIDIWCIIPQADSLADYNGGVVEENIINEINNLKIKLQKELKDG